MCAKRIKTCKASILVSVRKLFYSIPMVLISVPRSTVLAPIRVGLFPVALNSAGHKLTFIVVSIAVNKPAMPVRKSIEPSTLVKSAIRPGLLSKAFSQISHLVPPAFVNRTFFELLWP